MSSIPPKSKGAAYLFLILLGGLGAHRFYLRHTGIAALYVILYIATATCAFAAFPGSDVLVIIGTALLVLALIVDLAMLSGSVDRVNHTAIGENKRTPSM